MEALLAHLDSRTCARSQHRISASTQDFVWSPSSRASHRLRLRQYLLWQDAGQVRAQAPKCRPGSSLLGRPKDPERNLAEPTMLACALRLADPPSSPGPASPPWNSFVRVAARRAIRARRWTRASADGRSGRGRGRKGRGGRPGAPGRVGGAQRGRWGSVSARPRTCPFAPHWGPDRARATAAPTVVRWVAHRSRSVGIP